MRQHIHKLNKEKPVKNNGGAIGVPYDMNYKKAQTPKGSVHTGMHPEKQKKFHKE